MQFQNIQRAMQIFYNLIKKNNGGGAGRFETRIKSIVQFNLKNGGSGCVNQELKVLYSL